jgi:uncharacterized protein YndB with AHSA1/START domain
MAEQQIEIVRRFDFPVDVLFAAFTDPEIVEAWLAESVEIDPRVGGRFRFVSSGTDEAPGDHICSGTYQVFEPNRRLVQTWLYEGSMTTDRVETQISVEFRAVDEGSSEITFREAGAILDDPEENELAIAAWENAFDGLEEAIDELYAAD